MDLGSNIHWGIGAGVSVAIWQQTMYEKKLPENIDAFRELLQDYGKVPPEEVESHLTEIPYTNQPQNRKICRSYFVSWTLTDAGPLRKRDRAWQVHRYPCIGRWSFTRIDVTLRDPRYKEAVKRLTAPDSRDALLDLGCCFGQNIRQLVRDGVDPSRLYGTDIHDEFLELGFDLFRDRESLTGGGATFVAGDMLNPDDPDLVRFDGKITIIHACNFFHLFAWEQQVVIGKRVVRFLKPETKDALLFGWHIGSLKPGPERTMALGERHLHNEESFQKLWDEIGEKTDTKWRVESQVISKMPPGLKGFDDNARIMRYGVYQLPL